MTIRAYRQGAFYVCACGTSISRMSIYATSTTIACDDCGAVTDLPYPDTTCPDVGDARYDRALGRVVFDPPLAGA